MNKRNDTNSQPMHNHMSSSDSYVPPLPPPPVSNPPIFDDFFPMHQPPHWYDHNHRNIGVSTCHYPPISSFADIPPITSFNFNQFGATQSDNDLFIGDYNHCARMDAIDVDNSIRNGINLGYNQDYNYNPLPPPIANAQNMEPHHSFCSDTSNTSVSTNSTAYDNKAMDYGYYTNPTHPLYHQPAPIYRFPSGYKNVANQIYEDDLSSTSCTSFNGTIKQSPSLPSDNTVKTESLNALLLNDTASAQNKKQSKCVKPFVCPECGNRYKYKSSMKLHFKVHTKDAKICKECGKRFPHEHKLRIHMRSHTGERPYKCDLCPKAFSDKSNLNRHKRLHTGEKPYECEFCRRRYSDSSALVDHRRRKHTKEKPYQCQFCQKTFAASSDLTSHLAVHSNIRPFECKQCHKRFKRRSDVHKHMKTHEPKIPKSQRKSGKTASYLKKK